MNNDGQLNRGRAVNRVLVITGIVVIRRVCQFDLQRAQLLSYTFYSRLVTHKALVKETHISIFCWPCST